MANKVVCILIWIVLLSYSIAMFFFMNKKKDALLLKKIEIEIIDSLENKFVSKKEIVNLINVKFDLLKGKKIKDVDRNLIEKIVEKHSSVKNAEVYTNCHGVVKVKLQQRKPLFRVMTKKDFYVDEDRKIMPFSSKYTSRVCVVTGNVNKRMATGELFEFCEFLDSSPFWSSFIEQIHVNTKNDVVLIPKMGEFNILLGGFEDYSNKMLKLRAFLKNGKVNGIWGKYDTINLKYENQVVCVK